MMYVKRTAKEVIRLEMKKQLAGISNIHKDSQSERIASQLFNMTVYKNSSRVGIYLNRNDEVRTTKIVENIFANGKECFIPWYSGNDMKLVKLLSLEDLVALPKTKWCIPQPLTVDDREDSYTNGGLDLVLVPGVAFTTKGDRLGRGKGYYDRYLQSMMLFREQSGKKLHTVALAFKEQILDSLPNNPSDFVLDQVLHPELALNENENEIVPLNESVQKEQI